jgi:hypothetical protein
LHLFFHAAERVREEAIMTDMAAESATPTEPRRADERVQESIAKTETLGRRAAELARTAAEKVPAGVVVVVGAGALLALDAFGIGEVVTAGLVAYGTYRLLRRGAHRRAERAQAEVAR